MLWTSICSLAGLKCSSGADPDILGVSEDTRQLKPGYVFVATPGTHADGHNYADAAVRQGAVAIVGNREGIETWMGAPYGYTPDPRRAVALIAQEMQGNPSRALCLVGVTGTNGKSSVAALTQSILRTAGHKCGNFGTLGYDLGGEVVDAPLTTPNAETLASLFARARDAQCSHVVMEVSSHALEQDRVLGLDFNVAAFTNLTQDHLDYHKEMAVYREAKLKLFGLAGNWAVVNSDDEHAEYFRKAARAKTLCFGIKDENAQVIGLDIQLGFDATRFNMRTPWGEAPVVLPLLGRHSVYNALCAATICGALGVGLEIIVGGLEALPKVPGRFEPVNTGQDFQVVVDYAHTEDALLNTLLSARQLCTNRIILVFGCGGDRDSGKRSKMGVVAARNADLIIITSDNPRTENPQAILDAVESGVKGFGLKRGVQYWVEEDRKSAIAQAIGMAQAGDLVIIAGKGHEDYQIIGEKRIHFDDRECARELLEAQRG